MVSKGGASVLRKILLVTGDERIYGVLYSESTQYTRTDPSAAATG